MILFLFCNTDEFFPVVKLEMSGCAMSLEPSLVEYMKFLPLNSLYVHAATPLIESYPTEDIDSSPSTPHTLTSISSVESAVKVQEPKMWSMLKKYEVMVSSEIHTYSTCSVYCTLLMCCVCLYTVLLVHVYSSTLLLRVVFLSLYYEGQNQSYSDRSPESRVDLTTE